MYSKSQIKEIIKKLTTNPIKTLTDYYYHHVLGVVQLSHSSTGEDVILDWIIKKDNGLYIDIGGFHPVYGNNTYLFYKKGWRGICIEPNKIGFHKFLKKRPKDINLQIAAGSSNSELLFYTFDYAAISTCDKDAVQRYIDSGHKVIDKYTVPVWTLEKICDTYVKNKKIDILSIDVEGWDMDVLESNNWNKYKPNYIIVETVEYAKKGKHRRTKENDLFDTYLAGKGYKVIAETGINTIYKLL